MFPHSFYQPPKTKSQLQQSNIARQIQDLKESLAKMTPEEQSAFWDDIEGVGGEDTGASDVQNRVEICEKAIMYENSLQSNLSAHRKNLRKAQPPKWWQFWKRWR